jgi:transcriptional regulator with XRE-family HTH domain
MSTAVIDIDMRIGKRIRELRADRRLSREGLAALADVSRAMLSRIERGESSPTAQLLNKICSGLGVTLSTLFADTEMRRSPVARRHEQRLWRDPASGYVRRNVSPPNTGSMVEIAEIEFPPGASVIFDNKQSTGIDQQIWVLDGLLDLVVGDDEYQLSDGDCLWMPSQQSVVFRNSSHQPVRYTVIVCQQGSRPT